MLATALAPAIGYDAAAAIASFQKAIEGDSADPDYHFNLGYALWRAGQYAAAMASFRWPGPCAQPPSASQRQAGITQERRWASDIFARQ